MKSSPQDALRYCDLKMRLAMVSKQSPAIDRSGAPFIPPELSAMSFKPSLQTPNGAATPTPDGND
jgi:hypothetical protein